MNLEKPSPVRGGFALNTVCYERRIDRDSCECGRHLRAAAGFRAAALILILVLATGPGSYAIAYTIAISIFASVVVQVVGIS